MPSFAQPPQRSVTLAGSPAFPTLPTSMPSLSVQTTVNPTEVDVDLHDCLVGNMPLWKSAWTPVFELVSEATTSTADPPEMSDMMSSFMDVQLALQRCDIDPAKEAMLIDTFESGGKFKTKLNMPDEKAHSASVPQLGKAMHQMIVVIFPQEYEIDDTGR